MLNQLDPFQSLKDFIVIDTETTGIDFDKDQVIEVAVVDPTNNGILFQALCKPTIPIPPEASAIHHLTDAMFENVAGPELIMPGLNTVIKGKVIVAHNKDFDRRMLARYGVGADNQWICTWRLAQKIWPNAPGYKNQVLRYWRDYDIDSTLVHRAGADAVVTSYVFCDLLQVYISGYQNQTGKDPTHKDLLAFERSMITIHKMPFGKHFGQPVKEVPSDYLMWMIRKMTDMSPDLRWTVENEIKHRRGSNG